MTNAKKANNNLLNNLILVVLAFLFLLFFSNGTSPLSKYYGSDSAFFMFFGKAVNHGLKPYIDLFDHKGPYLFLIQQLGQLICENRVGAFIIQIINLSICMYIVDKIILLANNKLLFNKRLLFQIPLGIILAISFRDGNMCEEYSLPFLFGSLYLLIKYFIEYENNNYKHNLLYAFLYGLFFGIITFIRITNSAFICSAVLCIVILLIYKKEYKNIIFNAIMFIFGIIIAFIPIYVYYSSINGLETMLYSVFVYAYKYIGELSIEYRIKLYFTIENILLLIPALYPVLFLRVIDKQKTKYFLFACISFVATFLSTFIGQVYTHYFVLVLPNALFGVYLSIVYKQQSYELLKNRIILIILILILLSQSFFMFINLGKNVLQIVDYSISDKEQNYYSNLAKIDTDIGDYIPDDEKNSVWGYGIKARFYIRTNTYPCIKYFDYLDQRFAYIEIKKEIESLLKQNKPKWIVISKDKDSLPDFIENELEDNYLMFAENKGYYLYNRIYE